MKPLLLMIGGWAHPAKALQPLADAVQEFAEPRLLAAHEPLPQPERPAFLLGWSLGGLHVLRAAQANPDRWPGLIFVSSTARFCTTPDFPHGTEPARLRAIKAALRKDPESVLRQFFVDVAAPAVLEPDALESKIRAALALGSEQLTKGLEELLKTDLRTQSKQIAKPVLVVHGCDDRIIPCAAGEWLAAQFAFNRFVAVDAVGHDLPTRKPAKVAEEIKLFLETF